MKQKHAEKQDNSDEPNVRLDKWLWAARFCKTRSVAREYIQAGKVQYNGQRSKPSKVVELGALVKVPAGYDVKEVKFCSSASSAKAHLWHN